MNPVNNHGKAVLIAAFARMDATAMAIAMGILWAILLFAATILLLLKGAPEGGAVGPHLALLGVYLPGYSVSIEGALIGALEVGLIGAAAGALIAILWNLTHYLYVTLVVVRAAWLQLMAD